MPLYDWQAKDVDRLRAAVMRSKSVLYKLPTGGGKTVVATAIAQGAIDKGNSVMFTVHRRELVKQAIDTMLDSVPGVQVGVEAAGWPRMPWAKLQVGMVQSIVRRQGVAKPKIVIVDECHHARAKTWEKVLGLWPDAKIIGLTATPERLDGKGLGEHFAEMVSGPEIKELVDMDYLAPCRVLRIPSALRLEDVRKDRHGEYRADDVNAKVTDAVIADAVGAYQRYAMGKRAIFFGVHRDHSRRVAAGLRAIGVRAEHVDGDDSSARRDRIMGLFKTGGLDVVCNCNLISEGYDSPSCEVVIDGAPTMSITAYLQRHGRHRRKDPYNPGKVALSLDCAGNSHELGLPDDVREWSLEDGEIREAKKANKKPRDCPRCYTVFWGRVCPQCSHREAMAEVQTVDTELEEATGATVRKGRGRLTRKELNRELAIVHQQPDKEKALIALADRVGYERSWAYQILRIWGMGRKSA